MLISRMSTRASPNPRFPDHSSEMVCAVDDHREGRGVLDGFLLLCGELMSWKQFILALPI